MQGTDTSTLMLPISTVRSTCKLIRSTSAKYLDHILTTNCFTLQEIPIKIRSLNLWNLGAIHLWRPHGGGGGHSQVDACGRGRGQPHVDVRTEN